MQRSVRCAVPQRDGESRRAVRGRRESSVPARFDEIAIIGARRPPVSGRFPPKGGIA